uniref:Uncharacterized protein n=1 Tax=viral metagenome TaxID=1070528 RepID=A0A6M3JKQ6_9ZZZZ
MGITINKQVSVTIDGKDYDILSNILKLARRRMLDSPLSLDEFSSQEVDEIRRAMDKIWGN